MGSPGATTSDHWHHHRVTSGLFAGLGCQDPSGFGVAFRSRPLSHTHWHPLSGAVDLASGCVDKAFTGGRLRAQRVLFITPTTRGAHSDPELPSAVAVFVWSANHWQRQHPRMHGNEPRSH